MKFLEVCFIFVVSAAIASAQGLPNLKDKPPAKFEKNSFCAAEGLTSNDRNDPDLNHAKNRIDDADRYFPVDFNVIKNLDVPTGVKKTKRSNWPEKTREAVSDSEGIPIQLEGYLALTEKRGKLVGGVQQGAELCNCQKKEAEHVDFHLWLVNRVGDKKAKSVVIEMTPRVRQHHSNWTIQRLSDIGVRRLRVRVSGWLLLDQEHAGGIKQGQRANIWEIHPIMRFEYNENGRWKPL